MLHTYIFRSLTSKLLLICRQEVAGNLEDAVATYSKCLAVRPDHVVAKEALWALYARTEKIDVTLMSSAAATKIVEVKQKLKILLQDDIAAVKETHAATSDKSKKTKKERKSRKDSSDSDSSDSSSSESDSETSSSDSDSGSKGKRKKKSRKTKSKKSKRSRKDQIKEKEKERSLSPFSKRLGELQFGLSIG